MIINYNPETKYNDLHFEYQDICAYCDNCECCALLEALQKNIVYACQQDFSITECPMYNVGINLYVE